VEYLKTENAQEKERSKKFEDEVGFKTKQLTRTKTKLHKKKEPGVFASSTHQQRENHAVQERPSKRWHKQQQPLLKRASQRAHF
jgi:hypothetical protein